MRAILMIWPATCEMSVVCVRGATVPCAGTMSWKSVGKRIERARVRGGASVGSG